MRRPMSSVAKAAPGAKHVLAGMVAETIALAETKVLRKAAEQGNADAQAELGWCYVEGNGVQRDHIEAFKWFCKAVEQGGSNRGINVACCYEEGDEKNGGILQQDYVEAYKWFKLAAEIGAHEKVASFVVEHQKRWLEGKVAALSAKMSQEQIQEGERRYNEFPSSKHLIK